MPPTQQGALPLLLALWMLLGPGRAAAETGLAPLSAAESAILQELPDEKPYNVRIHFLRSNERRHDVFFPALRHLGGGYIGVGADQNYTLAAVAGAELLWLIDIDGDVVQWHKIYAALIPVAATSDELIALIAGGKAAQVKEALAARWPAAEATQLWPTFLRYRGMLTAHLKAEREVRHKGHPVTWVSSPELYRHVRALMQARRVIARVGDLHGETTLIAIGSAARRTGHLVRTFYMSNVEQWFRYSPQFRRNLAALPHDDKTVVLRTLARGELPAPDLDRWHFSVQTLDDFLFRMESAQPPARGVLDLMPEMAKARRPGIYGLSWLGTVQALPRPRIEWALLPPLRDDSAPPPAAVVLVPWQALPPLRAGSLGTLPIPAPAPTVVRAVVAWESLPPLRLGGTLAASPAQPPVGSPALLGSSQVLQPLQPLQPVPARPRIPWQRLPPLRAAAPVLLKTVAWQLLPPLRVAGFTSPAPAARDFRLLPPLHAGEPPQSPAEGRHLAWESLPALRDATVLPQRRTPWRRLPPLRGGELAR